MVARKLRPLRGIRNAEAWPGRLSYVQFSVEFEECKCRSGSRRWELRCCSPQPGAVTQPNGQPKSSNPSFVWKAKSIRCGSPVSWLRMRKLSKLAHGLPKPKTSDWLALRWLGLPGWRWTNRLHWIRRYRRSANSIGRYGAKRNLRAY